MSAIMIVKCYTNSLQFFLDLYTKTCFKVLIKQPIIIIIALLKILPYSYVLTFVMTLVALSAHLTFYLIKISKNRKHVFNLIYSLLFLFLMHCKKNYRKVFTWNY